MTDAAAPAGEVKVDPPATPPVPATPPAVDPKPPEPVPAPAAPAAAGDLPKPQEPAPAVAPKPDTAVAPTPAEPDKPAEPEVKPAWPSDWREVMAAGDAKELKRLQAFGSPEDINRSYRELEKKLSSGAYRKPHPGEEAKPEELAAWRKQEGIPETADKYEIKLADGLVVGEQDKPLVNKFVERLHGKNASPEVVNEALNVYYELTQEGFNRRVESNRTAKEATVAELMKEWGPDEYKNNTNIVTGLLDTMPQPASKALTEAYGPDGVPLMSNPNVIRSLFMWARQVNPLAGLNLPGGPTQIQDMESRLATIKSMMGNDQSEYWSKDKGPILQKEYHDLLAAQLEIKKRAA